MAITSFSGLSKDDLTRLDTRAKRNHRSRSGEIIAILRRTLRKEKILNEEIPNADKFIFTKKALQLLKDTR